MNNDIYNVIIIPVGLLIRELIFVSIVDKTVTLLSGISFEKVMEIVQICNASSSDIWFSSSVNQVSGKGILGAVSFMLSLEPGDPIVVKAKGTDADILLERIMERLPVNDSLAS